MLPALTNKVSSFLINFPSPSLPQNLSGIFQKYCHPLAQRVAPFLTFHSVCIITGVSLAAFLLYRYFRKSAQPPAPAPVQPIVPVPALNPAVPAPIAPAVNPIASVAPPVAPTPSLQQSDHVQLEAVLGPIRQDRKFHLAHNLRLPNKEPLIIDPVNDFYVRLYSTKTQSTYHLPSSLLQNKKSGERVSFYDRNILIELTLEKTRDVPFEDCLSQGIRKCLENHMQCGFTEDLPHSSLPFSIPNLFNLHLGDKHSYTTLHNPQAFQSIDHVNEYVAPFLQDVQHGPYKELSVKKTLVGSETAYTFDDLHIDETTRPLEFNRQISLKTNEIHLFRSQGIHGLDNLWVLIPHRRPSNSIPDNVFSVDGSLREEFVPDTRPPRQGQQKFIPQDGHRLAMYQYGQFYRISIPPHHTFEVRRIDNPYRQKSENPEHVLQIAVKPQEKM